MTDIVETSWIQHAFDRGFGRPIIPDPIPKLTLDAVPKTYRSFDIIPDLYVLQGPLREMQEVVEAALFAEDARLRRLLPPAPEGKEWQAEVSWVDHYWSEDDLRFGGETALRIRYRLAPILEGDRDR